MCERMRHHVGFDVRSGGGLILLLLLWLAGLWACGPCWTKAQPVQAKPRSRLIEKPDSVDSVLSVPFRVLGKAQLVIGLPRDVVGGLPHEAYQKLIIVFPGEAKAIEVCSLGDLRRRVSIQTTSGALAYCRLLTSPATWHLWDKEVEVVSRDQVDAGFCFGDRVLCSFLRRTHSGYLGIVDSKATLAKLQVRAAHVQASAAGFSVRRTLLVQCSGKTDPYCLQDIAESVGKDGAYRRRVLRKRNVPKLAGVALGLPLLM